MEFKTKIVSNWITKKAPTRSPNTALALTLLLVLVSVAYFHDWLGLSSLMSVSYQSVFQKHEYWRLWTALFVHADLLHLLSNLVLFLIIFRFWVLCQVV